MNRAWIWWLCVAVLSGCNSVPSSSTPNFSLVVGDGTVPINSSVNVNIAAAFSSGASNTVTLTLEGAPTGVTGQFSSNTLTPSAPNSVLSLTATSSASFGTFTLTVRGQSSGMTNTAKFTLTIISATSGGGGGGNGTLNLQLGVGTLRLLEAGSSTPRVGTLYVTKARQNNQPPSMAGNWELVTRPGVTGSPNVTAPYRANTPFEIFSEPRPPEQGSYTSRITFGQEQAQASTTLSDSSAVLAIPVITINNATSSSVALSWTAVPSAQSYNVAIVGNSGIVREVWTRQTATSFSNLSLAAGSYGVGVAAVSQDFTTPDPNLSGQVNASAAIVNFSIGGGGGAGSLSGTVSISGAGAAALDYSGTPLDSFVPGEIVVKFREGVELQSAGQMGAARGNFKSVQPLGLERTALYQTSLDPQLTLQTINELNQRPDVEYAQPNFIYKYSQSTTPNDALYSFQWHYPSINLPQAWSLETGTTNPVTVGVLDSGILSRHPDFADKLLPGYDFTSDATSAGDGDGRDPNPEDTNIVAGFHGSHVAGTIAAATNNSIGVAGVSWGARILPVRVGGSRISSIDVTDGLLWAVGIAVQSVPSNPNPAQIINMSLGGSPACRFDNLYQEAINRARAAGAIIVVASGNETEDAANSSPNSCSGVISVGASNSNNQRAHYSNYGRSIDVMAPGGSAFISLNGQAQGGRILSIVQASGQPTYGYKAGTSMAAPHVAGVVALMKSARPTLTAAEALDILKRTARPFSATQCSGEADRDANGNSVPPPSLTAQDCGAGLIDAFAAVQAARATATPGFALRPLVSGIGVGAGASRSITVNVDRWGGFTSTISLSAEGLPTGVTITPPSGAIGSSGNLQFTATSTAAPGIYPITLRGEGGGQSRTTLFTLVVGVQPSNQTLNQARVTAWFWDGRRIVEANSRTITLTSTNQTAPYSISGLTSGNYFIEGWIDTNRNNQYDDPDYLGQVRTNSGATAIISPPANGLNFSLSPYLRLSSLNAIEEALQERLSSLLNRSPELEPRSWFGIGH